MELIRPAVEYRRSFLQAMQGLREEERDLYLDWTLAQAEADFPGYVRALWRCEHAPEPGRVADSIYWAVRAGEWLGRIALRHELNDHLRRVGGHVGYYVRFSARRQGVGTEMLRWVLTLPRARALGRVMATCDATNEASVRLIRKFGGEAFEPAPDDRVPGKLYYWIPALAP